MKKYCEKCNLFVDTKIVNKNQTFKVFDDIINVEANLYICIDCNEELFDEELDNNTLVLAYNKYRKNHKLLFPESV